MSDVVTIEDCVVVAESAKAICVDSPNLDTPTWIPKSQVHDDSEVWDGGADGSGPGALVISAWFAEKEGLA